MKLEIYRRRDCCLIVVPAAGPQAKATAIQGALQNVGTAYLAASSLSPHLSRSIAIHGYGVAGKDDHFVIHDSIPRRPR